MHGDRNYKKCDFKLSLKEDFSRVYCVNLVGVVLIIEVTCGSESGFYVYEITC